MLHIPLLRSFGFDGTSEYVRAWVYALAPTPEFATRRADEFVSRLLLPMEFAAKWRRRRQWWMCVRHLESIRFVHGLFKIISVLLFRSYCCIAIREVPSCETLRKSQRIPPMHTWFYSNLKFSILYYSRLQNTFLIFIFNRFLGQRRRCGAQQTIFIEGKMAEIIVWRRYTKLYRHGGWNHIQNRCEKFNTKSFLVFKQAHEFEGRFPQNINIKIKCLIAFDVSMENRFKISFWLQTKTSASSSLIFFALVLFGSARKKRLPNKLEAVLRSLTA